MADINPIAEAIDDPVLPANNIDNFALFPSSATNTIINYSTRTGMSIFIANTKSLYRSDDERFDLQAEGLQTFLSLVSRRITSAAWDVDVPIVNDAHHNTHGPWLNMVTHHGQLELPHLKEYCITFIDNPVRAAQDNVMFVETLLESLSLIAVQKVMSWSTDWHLGPNLRPAALCLLKIIIRESYIDSNATIRILREQLSSLPDHLSKFSGRIPDLNQFVRMTVDQLAARGTTSTDLVANLFKGYLSSHDRTFVAYIEKKQEEFDEGTDIQPSMLMTLADNKYKVLVQTEKWMAPTNDDKKIIALETKIAQLKKVSAPSSKKPSGYAKGGKGKEKSNKPISPALSKYPGKDFIAANKSMQFGGHDHWWCVHHKRFCRHKSDECRNKKPATSMVTPNAAAATATPTAQSTTPNLRVSQAVLMDE